MRTDPEPRSPRLSALVERLQAAGRYAFVQHDIREGPGRSVQALKKGVGRLIAKGRIVAPRRGFYVVVPAEYRGVGAPPPPWFIDDLMRFQACPYYVGLLSAAALHGAGHHQPQEFQVVAARQLRPIRVGRASIRFFVKRRLSRTPALDLKTETGSMRVSTPEATAIDLMLYPEGAGHLGNVAAVLADLAEGLDGAKLAAAARASGEMASAQRLGYLLERVGAQRVAGPLGTLLSGRRTWTVPLRPDRPTRGAPRDERWNILVNEDAEVAGR